MKCLKKMYFEMNVEQVIKIENLDIVKLIIFKYRNYFIKILIPNKVDTNFFRNG